MCEWWIEGNVTVAWFMINYPTKFLDWLRFDVTRTVCRVVPWCVGCREGERGFLFWNSANYHDRIFILLPTLGRIIVGTLKYAMTVLIKSLYYIIFLWFLIRRYVISAVGAVSLNKRIKKLLTCRPWHVFSTAVFRFILSLHVLDFISTV